MTAIVGILSKKGVALAADSAVTRNRRKSYGEEEKIAKNGNKMVRLCELAPICVMVAGEADFLQVPWDIILRRYRTLRGAMSFQSMEDVVRDFFNYISESEEYWDQNSVDYFLKITVLDILDDAMEDMSEDAKERNSRTGCLVRPALFKRELKNELRLISRAHKNADRSVQFKDYTVEQFAEASSHAVDQVFEAKAHATAVPSEKLIPMDILEAIRPELYIAVLSEYAHRNDRHDYTQLIFCGYCANSKYPSLIPVIVNEGVDRRVNYHYYRKEIQRISDRHPVEICPFACTDVMETVLSGSSPRWKEDIYAGFIDMFSPHGLFAESENGLNEVDFLIMDAIKPRWRRDLSQQYNREIEEYTRSQKEMWEELINKQDLNSMADFAEDLIYLTAFYRTLTFEQEGVGGLIDKATISKKDGFTWLNRKSWYHHVDTDGEHGELGI